MPHSDSRRAFLNERCLIVLTDLAGFAEAFRHHSDLEIARFVDAYYHLSSTHVAAVEGQVVKFIGDACLTTFAPTQTRIVVDALSHLDGEVQQLGQTHDIQVRLGANLVIGELVTGRFGPRRVEDVIGSAVNQAFRLGAGPGIRLSEAAYRSLPSDARSGWRKRKPAVVYER